MKVTLQAHFDFQQKLHRRTLLKGAGVSMAMPWLSAMDSTFAASTKNLPKRFVAMTLGLGLLADNLNPTQTGREYQPSPYLKDFHDLRNDFTVISGTSHPGVGGGHRAESSLLSAAPMSAGIPSGNTVSVDQLLAKHLGHETRFPSLVLALSGSNSPSYTENGSMIPAESSPSRLFKMRSEGIVKNISASLVSSCSENALCFSPVASITDEKWINWWHFLWSIK